MNSALSLSTLQLLRSRVSLSLTLSVQLATQLRIHDWDVKRSPPGTHDVLSDNLISFVCKHTNMEEAKFLSYRLSFFTPFILFFCFVFFLLPILWCVNSVDVDVSLASILFASSSFVNLFCLLLVTVCGSLPSLSYAQLTSSFSSLLLFIRNVGCQASLTAASINRTLVVRSRGVSLLGAVIIPTPRRLEVTRWSDEAPAVGFKKRKPLILTEDIVWYFCCFSSPHNVWCGK